MVVYTSQLYKPLFSLKANSNSRFERDCFCYSSSLIVVRVKMGVLLSKNLSNFVLLSSLLELLPMKKVYNNMLSLDTKPKNIVSLNARTGIKNTVSLTGKTNMASLVARTGIKNTVSLTGKTNMASLVARTGRHLQRYDTVGYRQVVGCIPYRYRKTNKSEELEVLLISSQKGKGMLFPKGGWEEDEDIRDAALRETFEEAGVRGELEEKLGMWPYKSKRCDIMHNGYMFPLLVNKELKQWPEQNIRKREWMTATKAREVCQQGWMKAALDELISRQMKNSDK